MDQKPDKLLIKKNIILDQILKIEVLIIKILKNRQIFPNLFPKLREII